MKKIFTLMLPAAVLAVSAIEADAAPLRAARAMLASLPEEVTAASVEVGSEVPELSFEGANVEGLQTLVSPAAILRERAANSASAARRALASTMQIVGYSNVAKSPVNAYTFYYLPIKEENTGADFKLISKFNSSRTFDRGGVYDTENFTFTAPSVNVQNPFGDFIAMSLRGYYKINLTTGRYTVQNDNLYSGYEGMAAMGMAGDPTQNGIGYGVYGRKDDVEWEPLFYSWNRVDYEAALTATSSSIKDCIKVIKKNLTEDEILYYVCATDQGEYYGINQAGQLRKVDKATGEQTVVGTTTVDVSVTPVTTSNGKGGATFNPRNGTMLVYTINSDSAGAKLYEVDLASAETTVVATYDNSYDISNLIVMPALAADKAPDAPTLVVTCEQGSMEIGYTISLPSTLYDGTPITGAVEWEITANGEVILDGKNMAGSSVGGSLTLTTPGQTEFIAVAKNAEGNSPKAKQSLFVGPGLPGLPTNVKASWFDGQATVSWTAPTKSSDGGYVNPDEFVYEVTTSDGILLARLTGETSYSFTLPRPDKATSYQYGVSASYMGRKCDIAPSTMLWVGEWDLPYTPQLQGTPSPDAIGFVTEDKDGSGTWYLTSSSSGCAINVYNKQDDWLFLPDLKFEAGKVYVLDFDVNGSNSKMVVTEIYAGKGQRSDVMNIQVMEPTGLAPISYGNLTHQRHKISVPEDGIYNVGFHVSASASMGNWISIDYLNISEGFAPEAPNSFFINSVVPDKTGENTFSVNVSAPWGNMAGDELDEDELFSCEVLVNGEVVSTYTDKIKASGAYELKGSVPERGTYEIGVRGIINDNYGPVVTKTVYVGPKPMAAPTNVNLFLGSPEGNVTMTWDAVTLDVEGTEIPAKNVTYMVYGITADGQVGEPLLKAPVSTTYATFPAVEPGKQVFAQYLVGALNHGLDPVNYVASNARAVGTPMEMPLQYTNSQTLNTYLAGIRGYAPAGLESYITDDKVFFSLANQNSFQGISGGSDDNEYFVAASSYRSLGNDFFTGLINLKDAENPQVIFDLLKLDEADTNTVSVIVECNDQEEVIYTTDKADFNVLEWTPVVVDLSAYKGKYIQVKLRLVTMAKVYSFFDNLRIMDRRANDVAILNVTAPNVTKLDEKYPINVLIENKGMNDANNFDIELYRDGVLFETQNVGTLAPLETVTAMFEDVINYFDEDSSLATYQVKVKLAGDEVANNNESDEFSVERRVYRLPVVSDLAAEDAEDGEGVRLSWSSYTHNPEDIMTWTEDFEGDEVYHGDEEYLDWTMVDVDKHLVGGIQINVGGQYVLLDIPNHQFGEDTGSFFIWDWEDHRVPAGGFFAAHSGRNMLVNLYTVNDAMTNYEEIDDWAISPLLSGNAQTISFWARPFEVHQQEEMEIYYTTEDSTDPADFILLGETIKLPVNGNLLSNEGDWMEYTAELPEGALHFAIRCMSEDGFMLCLDDFTYESAGGPCHDLVGYDVYRDGVKINKSILFRNEFVDKDCPLGDHTYHVVGVFAAGNSELSNPASISRAGLNDLFASKASLKVENRDIVVTTDGADRVSIATVDGRMIHAAAGSTRLTVTPGIYLVTIGNKTAKLFVK